MSDGRFYKVMVGGLTLWAGCTEIAPEVGPDAGAVRATSGFGTTRMRTQSGIRTIRYEIIDGHGIYGGDVDLGPVEDLPDAHLRGGAIVDAGDLWPGGVMRYYIDPGVSALTRATIQDGIQDLRDHTPVQLVELSAPGGDYVRYLYGPADAYYHGMSDSVGMDGGEQTIKFRMPVAGANEVSQGTVEHETLHALGFFHEQERNDRDAGIKIDYDCIIDEREDQFDVEPDSQDDGPYDYESIMHYPSDKFCDTYGPFPPPGHTSDECICAASGRHGMVKRNTGELIPGTPVIPKAWRPGPPTKLSREDVNNLYRVYGKAIGSDSAGDHFGAAVASGDFDHDGYDDVAFGVPYGDPSGVTNAGEVLIFRGTSAGLRAWDSINAGNGIAGDHFGASLAVGDFDGDGTDDLAVGAPDADVAGVADAGAVYVFRGQQTRMMLLAKHTEAADGGGPVAGEKYGHALASGRFAPGSNAAWLAIGAPKEVNTLFIWPMFVQRISGAVYLLRDGTVVKITEAPLDTIDSGDDFGWALAVGDTDHDAVDDLVVGAPEGASAGVGAVYVYRGSSNASAPVTALAELKPTSGASNDRFGRAVAVGNLIGTVGGFAEGVEIVVGAPGTGSNAGKVYIFGHDSSGFGQVQSFSQPGSGQIEAGDQFGYALATAKVVGDDHDDLIVGVPGEDSNAGRIEIFHGGDGVTWDHSVRQTGWIFGDEDAGDRFGEALAVGDIDGAGDNVNSDELFDKVRIADVIVGAPGEAPNVWSYTDGPAAAGAAFPVLGELGAQPAPVWWYQQSSP